MILHLPRAGVFAPFGRAGASPRRDGAPRGEGKIAVAMNAGNNTLAPGYQR